MRRKPRPTRTDPRPTWMIEQGRLCGCKGTDDMCPCQNENPWPRARRDLEGEVRTLELQQQTDRETIASLIKAREAAEQRLKAVTEALEPFIKLAAETLTPGSPDDSEWLAEAKDWTVIFSFGGHSITLGDLRRAVQAQEEAQDG